MDKNKIIMKKTALAVWQAMDKDSEGFVKWTVFREKIPAGQRGEYLAFLKENWFIEERKGRGRPGIMLKPKYLRNVKYGSKPKTSPKPRPKATGKIDENNPLNDKKWISSILAAKYLEIKTNSMKNLYKKIQHKKTLIQGNNVMLWLVSDLVKYKQNRSEYLFKAGKKSKRAPVKPKINDNPTEKVYPFEANWWPALKKLADEATKVETVNHPKHYNLGKIEVIDAIEDWNLNFSEGNIIKYIVRAGNKSDNRIEDLQKALFYLKRIIQNAE